jgi:hypothetical protein
MSQVRPAGCMPCTNCILPLSLPCESCSTHSCQIDSPLGPSCHRSLERRAGLAASLQPSCPATSMWQQRQPACCCASLRPRRPAAARAPGQRRQAQQARNQRRRRATMRAGNLGRKKGWRRMQPRRSASFRTAGMSCWGCAIRYARYAFHAVLSALPGHALSRCAASAPAQISGPSCRLSAAGARRWCGCCARPAAPPC